MGENQKSAGQVLGVVHRLVPAVDERLVQQKEEVAHAAGVIILEAWGILVENHHFLRIGICIPFGGGNQFR